LVKAKNSWFYQRKNDEFSINKNCWI
jgi:hypothetical protein